MKIFLPLLTMLFLAMSNTVFTQDTFSIVAADSTTREVGSAGASCLDLFAFGFPDATFIGDLLPDTGAINTQALYLPANQNNARARMRLGETPIQIINWLSKHDAGDNSTVRQYGIVGFNGSTTSAAGFTGVNCTNYKNHITGNIDGIYYSIQGNILLNQQILDSMEFRFRNSTGDLACKLMASLQGANTIGADTRCTPDGTSSLFAFIKVAQPTDAYGSPSFNISVRTRDNSQIEPIDSLQSIFDAQISCETTGVKEDPSLQSFNIYPNPVNDEIIVNIHAALIGSIYVISDSSGRQIMTGKTNGESFSIDVHQLNAGLYTIEIGKKYVRQFVKN